MPTIIDVERVRSVLRLHKDGVVFWSAPSKHHKYLYGKVAGNKSANPAGKAYWVIQVDGRKFRRSWIVFCLTHGHWPSDQIDHIDGDSLNDRPENLREATPTQNAWNHKRRAKRSPLPMGVRAAASGRFVARIAVNKQLITIGTFNSSTQASSAYLTARRVHFGDFA